EATRNRCGHPSPTVNSVYRVLGRTNSMPNFGAAAIILSISLYGVSGGGGSVMDGAGTLNSLKNFSSPPGVKRMRSLNWSESITNECTVWRGTVTIDPGVNLTLSSRIETVISPSST